MADLLSAHVGEFTIWDPFFNTLIKYFYLIACIPHIHITNTKYTVKMHQCSRRLMISCNTLIYNASRKHESTLLNTKIRIFDSPSFLTTKYFWKNSYESLLPNLHTSFGTFCVQSGQSFKPQTQIESLNIDKSPFTKENVANFVFFRVFKDSLCIE